MPPSRPVKSGVAGEKPQDNCVRLFLALLNVLERLFFHESVVADIGVLLD
jgi:hypothetical protein